MEILCTLGPASLRATRIRQLTELGVTLFRINLSHTDVDAVPELIRYVRKHTSVPICLDTEGAQVRTGRLAKGQVVVRSRMELHVHDQAIVGDRTHFSFYPSGVARELEVGRVISIDSVLAEVIAKRPDEVKVRVLNGGKIGQHRAVTVFDGPIELPPLTQKDRAALSIGRELGIRDVALSFANRASDVDEVRRLSGDDAAVTAKIECRAGVENLVEIGKRADSLLIDRGDLSREVPIEQIPGLQKAIIRTGKAIGKRVFVATNLLESMVVSPTPTRAEVNDVYNTLLDGSDGLVLAAETAIGRYPVGCLSMVSRIINQFEQEHGFVVAPGATPVRELLAAAFPMPIQKSA